MRKYIATGLIGITLFASSCGTTKLTLSRNVPGATAVIDGEYHGNFPVEITRTGIPRKKLVQVMDANGQEIANTTIKRRVKPGTVIWGLVLLPIGYVGGIAVFVFDWKYERKVIIDVPYNYDEFNQPAPSSPWDKAAKKSVWD